MAYHALHDLESSNYSGDMYCVCKVATDFDDAGEWINEYWSVCVDDNVMEEADFDTLEEAIEYSNSYPDECIRKILKQTGRNFIVFNIEHDTWNDGDRESNGCVKQICRHAKKAYTVKVVRSIEMMVLASDEEEAKKIGEALSCGYSDLACTITNNAICNGDDEFAGVYDDCDRRSWWSAKLTAEESAQILMEMED